MSLIALDEAKTYLRVDGGMDDELIGSLLLTAEKLTEDVARLTATEWEKLCDETTEEMTIRDTELLVERSCSFEALSARRSFIPSVICMSTGKKRITTTW